MPSPTNPTDPADAPAAPDAAPASPPLGAAFPAFAHPSAAEPLAHHLYTWACQNAWANLRLHAACARLSDADFRAQRTSFFPSIEHTLNHILTVDWYYVDALEAWRAGRPPAAEPGRAFFTPERPHATLAPLAAAQRAVDRRLVAVCATLTDTRLREPVAIQRRAGLLHERADRLLAHLFEHQIHHRGQAHAMLAGTAVAPPQLDEFFCAQDAPLRAAELAELGLDEASVWQAQR